MFRVIIVSVYFLLSVSLYAQTFSVNLGKVSDKEALPSSYYTKLRDLNVHAVMLSQCSSFEYCMWSGLYRNKEFAQEKLKEYKTLFPDAKIRRLDKKSVLKIIDVADFGKTAYENRTDEDKPDTLQATKSAAVLNDAQPQYKTEPDEPSKPVEQLKSNKEAPVTRDNPDNVPSYTIQLYTSNKGYVPETLQEKLAFLEADAYYKRDMDKYTVYYYGNYHGYSAAKEAYGKVEQLFGDALIVEMPQGLQRENSVEEDSPSREIKKTAVVEKSETVTSVDAAAVQDSSAEEESISVVTEEAVITENNKVAEAESSRTYVEPDRTENSSKDESIDNDGSYTYQFMTLTQWDIDEKSLEALKANGFDTYYSYQKGKFTLLYAGRYPSRDAAKEESDKVHRLFNDAILTPLPQSAQEHTIEITPAEESEDNGTFYTFQVMSFKQWGLEQQDINAIEAIGYDSYYKHSTDGYTVIYIGKYAGYSGAKEAYEKVSEHFKDAYVVKLPENAEAVMIESGEKDKEL